MKPFDRNAIFQTVRRKSTFCVWGLRLEQGKDALSKLNDILRPCEDSYLLIDRVYAGNNHTTVSFLAFDFHYAQAAAGLPWKRIVMA